LQEAIKAGTILIKDGTVFPEALRLDSALYSTGWRSFTGLDGHAVDRKTRDAGWTFFYLAGESRASVLGGEGQDTVRRAIKQILAGLKTKKFNSLEITRVVFKHFLGIPYATVSYHRRNMQKSIFLSGSGDSEVWKNKSLAAA
jgi:hypothetical protein